MVKTKQFNARMYYVTPSCKSVMLHAKQTILSGSLNENSADPSWVDGGDGVNNYEDL